MGKQDQVELTFSPRNLTRHNAEETVTVHFHVKNVPSLLLRVFDINTWAYYISQLQQVGCSWRCMCVPPAGMDAADTLDKAHTGMLEQRASPPSVFPEQGDHPNPALQNCCRSNTLCGMCCTCTSTALLTCHTPAVTFWRCRWPEVDALLAACWPQLAG